MRAQEMMALARQKYGQALRHTGELIRPSVNPSFEVTMRSVVMLALFEVSFMLVTFIT